MSKLFQDTTTGVVYTFFKDMVLSDLATAHPELPTTLTDTNIVLNPGKGYVWENGAWVADTTTALAALKATALSALAKTDDVYIRCGKAGVAFPHEWIIYVMTLRAILNSSSSVQVWPIQPPYPAGT